ncbi:MULTISPECIES: hypothetical protein [unclassified Rathayibacter]|uniref:hypothetical protein n=1 Tax=unclassified Rathayibacter TaxID=2609250 RepID=UPI001053AD2C|nr:MULTISPECIES: hypothetical protein [unclassified Rathayibacter]TCL83218.1 hypothetical protein EDF49_104271 [Rathayibacter sp. PhB192]TCM28716.1 hypothetical protein EDF43_104272 [Rathayibacter sp. PhB179]
MHADEYMSPEELPEPPTLDVVTRFFRGPLFTLTPQPSLEEWVSSASARDAGGVILFDEASIGYTFWRNPDDHDDPANLEELGGEPRPSLDVSPTRPVPEWMAEIAARMPYPQLWDAVRTSVAEEHSPWQSIEFALLEHVNRVLRSRLRSERAGGSDPGELLGPAMDLGVEHGVPLLLDGRWVPGIRIDTDPHVLGVGAHLGDRFLTAVVDRDRLPFLDFTFVTRHARG